MAALYCFLIGYFIGGINPSYIIAKLHKFDIRSRGSGNAGASNAVITMGTGVGVFCALFDIFKAFFTVKLCVWLFPESVLAESISGVSCIVGHIFPVLMKFKGGKGLAAFGGVVLAFDIRVFAVMLAVEIALALITDYICIVPMTASVVFPFIYRILTGKKYGALIYAVAAIIMIFRHRENIERIKNGTEAHLSFLWKREKEQKRLEEADNKNSGN